MDERVRIYAEITGHTPSCFQQDLIGQRVADADKWRKAVIWWMGNGYRPQSVAKVIDYYEKEMESNPANRNPSLYVGAYSSPASESIDDTFCYRCRRGQCYEHGTQTTGAIQ